MSQKTNPLSLRLQKTSRNFAFPWFADFFWTDIYLKNLEIEKYITTFLNQTQHSKAFFSSKTFYRKYSIFLFLHDSRLSKRKNQLALKKKALPLSSEKRPSNMIALLSQKMILNPFWTDSAIDPSSTIAQKTSRAERTTKVVPRNCFSFCEKIVFPLALPKAMPTAAQGSTPSTWQENLTSAEQSGKNQKGIPQQFTPRVTSTLQIGDSQSRIRALLASKMPPKIVRRLPVTPLSKQNSLAKTEIVAKIPFFSKNKNCAFVKSFGYRKGAANLKTLQIFKLLTNLSHNCETISQNSILGCLGQNQRLPSKFVDCENTFSRFFPVNVHLQPIRFTNYYQNVITLTDQVVELLEKRISFRQIKHLLFNNIFQNSYIKGIRISCSGRLGGRSKKAQKAKLQSDSIGRTPLASFSSKISFYSKSAYTPYGKIGVKVWLSFEDTKQ